MSREIQFKEFKGKNKSNVRKEFKEWTYIYVKKTISIKEERHGKDGIAIQVYYTQYRDWFIKNRKESVQIAKTEKDIEENTENWYVHTFSDYEGDGLVKNRKTGETYYAGGATCAYVSDYGCAPPKRRLHLS